MKDVQEKGSERKERKLLPSPSPSPSLPEGEEEGGRGSAAVGLKSVAARALDALSDNVNENLRLYRAGFMITTGCLAVYGMSRLPPFTRFKGVREIPSYCFANRAVVRGRLTKVVEERKGEPVAFRFVALSWFERTFLNVRDVFDKFHGGRGGGGAMIVQLRNVGGVQDAPTEGSDRRLPPSPSPSPSWLSSFVNQKPYVACRLISRRVSSDKEVAVVDITWRPYLSCRRSDLASSLLRHGRGECTVDEDPGGVTICGVQYTVNVDGSRKLQDLETDVQRIQYLGNLEEEARRNGAGCWKGADKASEEEGEEGVGLMSILLRLKEFLRNRSS